MTHAERARAVAYLEQTRDAILDSTATLTDAEWKFKPVPEAWSPAECIEHITITETMLLNTIQELAKGPPAPEEVLAQTPGKEEIIVKMVPSRKRKVTTPEAGRPTGAFYGAQELRAHFTSVRDRTIYYVRTTEDPIRTCTREHFVFGPLDGYQWVLFMAAHSERHLKQLEEVLAAT